MRNEDDYTYQEYKENAFWDFGQWRENPDNWPPEMTANWIIYEGMGNIYGFLMTDISEFLFFLSSNSFTILFVNSSVTSTINSFIFPL